MNRRLEALFSDHETVLLATQECRERGYEIIDVYAPYPAHGLEEAMGLGPSRIPFVCFLLGVCGAGGMLAFQIWASAIDWPANIGGKPLNSLPAFVPVTFETAILCAGLGTILVLLILSRLFPTQRSPYSDPRLSDDHFLLAIRQTDADLLPSMARDLLVKHGAIEVHEIPQEERS